MSATERIYLFYGSVKPLAFTQQAHALIILIKLLTFVKIYVKLSLHEA